MHVHQPSPYADDEVKKEPKFVLKQNAVIGIHCHRLSKQLSRDPMRCLRPAVHSKVEWCDIFDYVNKGVLYVVTHIVYCDL